MEQTTAENKQTTTGAAPAAAVAPVATPPVPPTSGKPAETTQPTPEQKKEPQTPQEKVEFFKARQETKKKADLMAEELARLRQENEALKKAPAPAQTENKQPPSLLDDPDGYARWVNENALKTVDAELQARERAFADSTERAAATSWLLSQSHVKEDAEFAKTVAQLLQTPKAQGGLWEAAQADPLAAAQVAVNRVREAAGIAGESDKGKSAQGSTGVRPSSSSSGGKKLWTGAEVKKYLSELPPSGPTRQAQLARLEEIAQARREGRVS